MMFNKPILLLLISSSFLPFFTQAICVPRNKSSSTHAPAIASSPIQSPTPSPSSTRFASPHPSHVQPLAPPTSLIPSSPLEYDSAPPPLAKPPSISSLLPPKSHPILEKICGVTQYPQVCINTVLPFLTSTVDPLSVLKIEMQVLRNGFKKAMATAKTMMNDPKTSPWVKSCLDTCLDVYDSGIFDLDNALKAIVSRDIYRLKTLLSGTISYVETCEDSFTEEPGVDSPMKNIDEELDKLASNNLAITNNLLHWA